MNSTVSREFVHRVTARACARDLFGVDTGPWKRSCSTGRDAEVSCAVAVVQGELEAAGCFSLVLECVPSEAARKVTDLLKIPTIGIGAGASVRGQVLVYQDVLGLNPGSKPKFLRTYENIFGVIQTALNA
jgi:3-methyl-2-oxobutanoate hydroxymethyltransferase